MTITRRSVGGYEYRNALEEIEGLGEQLENELTDLGLLAPNVETSRRFIRLIMMSSQIRVTAMGLREYRIKTQ